MSLDDKLQDAEKKLGRKLSVLEKTLVGHYSEALKRLRYDLARQFELYAKDGVLTHNEMAKLNRMQLLQQGVVQQLRSLGIDVRTTMQNGLRDQYSEMFYRTAFSLETEVGLEMDFTTLNTNQIEASVMNPIDKLTLTDRLEVNRKLITSRIVTEITQGIIRGESYDKMAKRIKEQLGFGTFRTLLIARTEAHRVQMEGRNASFEIAKESGVEMKKVWHSTLDKRTRDTHRSLDGQKVDPDTDFVLHRFTGGGVVTLTAPYPSKFGVASEDIQCRCTFRMEIDGFSPSVRRARDKDGNSVLVPNMTYAEWMQYKGIS